MPYAYLLSLVIAPVGMVTECLALIPVVHGIDLGATLTGVVRYEFYLLILATAASLYLRKIRAAIALLAPFGFLLLLILIGILAGVPLR